MSVLKLAVLASGKGTNCAAIQQAIAGGKLNAKIVVLITNNPDAGVLDIAREQNIPFYHIASEQFATKDAFYDRFLNILSKHGAELIVLAGYMKKIGAPIIRAYPNKILNIHPALLPAFGGKGLYGMFVHEAVIKYGAKVTGVTIHLVDEEYDHGPVVMQRCLEVLETDTPESLSKRVQALEYDLYWQAIRLFAENKISVKDRKIFIS